MGKLMMITVSIAALSLATDAAMAQGKKGGGGGQPGGVPPTWSGANPPGFNSPGSAHRPSGQRSAARLGRSNSKSWMEQQWRCDWIPTGVR